MRLFLFLLTGLLFAATPAAQLLTGRIIDTKGQPVPNATFYIRELALGLIADGQGDFRTKIEPGDYTCEVSSLGYERKTLSIVIPAEGLALNVELHEKTYAIREVTVTPGKEDPAYGIMRKVISRAPGHLHQVKSYESGVYIKGTFKVDKIPALIKMQIKDREIREMIGKTFLFEMQNEVTYHEPDRYEQHVIALSGTVPAMFNLSENVPLSMIANNIYTPSAFGGLLAPGSFSLYKFRLEDSYEEDGRYINKILVTPRKKSGQLVNGRLYIVENTWSIQQANLSLSQAGTDVRFHLTYHEIKPGAFLPAAYDLSVNIDMLGIKGKGQFYASIKYNRLETNDNYMITAKDTAQPAATPVKTQTKKQQKDLKKLEELANKEKLSTREAYQMAQLMEKTVESEEVKAQKRRLERRPLDSLIVVTRDSLALSRDSAYWAEHRNLPLREEELQSYLRRDSLKKSADTDARKKRTATGRIAGLLLGEKISTGKKTYIKYDGLLLACPEYNFVDGFRLGQKIEAGINLSDNRLLSLSPAVYYTTARKEMDVTVDGTLTYAPMRNGKFVLSTGNTTADYAAGNGTGRFGNTLGSLFLAKNTAKFYLKRYISLSNRIDLANGLALHTGLNYEKRNSLANNTSYRFFGGRPADNLPHGQTGLMPSHNALTADITVEYTPRYYYNVWKGRKFYTHSDYPTISLHYSRAFGTENNSSFDKMEATILQDIRLNLFNRLSYEFNAGTFTSARQTYLPDFKHFRTNEMFLTGKSFNNSFSLLENYRYATNDKWLQAHVAYTSQYLLLKQIPFMQGLLFNESLHIRTLWLPHLNHSEAGYSIGFDGIGRIGIFAGFNGLNYESTGFTISLPLLNIH
ncbi:MAG: DUF5686 and carboxypeptidase regulatory-like domain-containing protein [Tannerella sp.]|jgi:hypothetical protein|nr:DUF5686 and carboxypeptidase regulatory-like domain-containing protein [Tannerella sp.]